MFVDLDWPLNASSLLSASAELLVESETETGLVLRPTVSDHVTVHQGARPRGTTLTDGLCFPENWISSNFTCRRPKSNLCWFMLLLFVNVSLQYKTGVSVTDEVFYPVQIVCDSTSLQNSLLSSLLWMTESTAFGAFPLPWNVESRTTYCYWWPRKALGVVNVVL